MANDRYIKRAIGEHGFQRITAASTGSVPFCGILVIEGSATLSAVSDKGDNLTSGTHSEGVYIPGPFTSITVTSGKVLGMYANDPDV